MLEVKTISYRNFFCAEFALKKGLNKLATIPVTTQGAITEENKVLIILKKLKILIHAQRLENIINIHTYIFIASSPQGFSESTLQL